MPRQISNVRKIRRESETSQNPETLNVTRDECFEVFRQECDENQSFGLDMRRPLHQEYYYHLTMFGGFGGCCQAFHSFTRASVRGATFHRPPRRPVAAAAEEAG